MREVVRLSKKFPDKESFGRNELAEALSKEMSRTVSEALVGELVAHGVARTLGSPDKVAINAAQVSRRIVFENTCRLLKECKDSEV